MLQTKETLATQDKPLPAAAGGFMRFVAYSVEASFRKLDSNIRLQAKEEALSAIDAFREQVLVVSYSLMSTQAGAELMLWEAADDLEQLDQFSSKFLRTPLGPYLKMTRSALGLAPGIISGVKTNSSLQFPSFTGKPGSYTWLLAAGLSYAPSWHSLALTERARLMAQAHQLAQEAGPKVVVSSLQSAGFDDFSEIAIFESESSHLLAQAAQRWRALGIQSHIRHGLQNFSGPLREPKWILDSVG
ncbi:MAG: chlorite dismutase family protein [Elusimicrobia bacterium]|nr:chlorite dismutase family protein [Elusimicrobiota bacterium]